MSDPKRLPPGTSDLVAGVAATAALGGTFFVLHIPVLMAAGVAVAVYGGARLLMTQAGERRDDDTELAHYSVLRGRAQVKDIQEVVASVSKQSVREKVSSICSSAEQIFTIFESDPKKTRLARGFVEYTLERSKTILIRNRDLSSRPITSAKETLGKVEALLGTIDQSFQTQIERLLQEDVASLDSEIDVLKTRLDFEGEVEKP